MNNFCKATTATALAATFAMLLVGTQQPASAQQAVYGPSAVQLADRADDENGDNENNNGNNCTNPAGNQRGWCKHDNERRECIRNHRHDRDACGRGQTFVSGTVLGWNGNQASFRLDSGRVITLIDNAGGLAVGGHYRLAGHYGGNGIFVVGGNNGYTNPGYPNGNYGNGGQAASQISGTVMSVGQDTVTLVGVPPITINVRQAINRGANNGAFYPGRHITAYGYYSNGIFYATSVR